jgi:diguanylate cyclase (GGDEF)-like protein/PAS domain S-box-containing protein
MRMSDEMKRIFGVVQGGRFSYSRYIDFVHPDDRMALDGAWRAALKRAPFDQEHRVMVNGAVRWVRQKAALVHSAQGQALRAEGIVQDITERKLMELALKDSEERYRTLVELTPQPVLVHREGRVLYVNDAAVALFGAPNAAHVLGQSVAELVHPDSRAAQAQRMQLIHEKGGVPSVTEARFLKMDGTPIDVQVQGTSIVYQGLPAIQVAVHDVSALKAQQAALARMAHFDMLTGLPNRVLLADRLQQAMAHSKRHHQRLAVVFLDLDGFKAVNDGHGHEAGDHLLVTLAARMRHALREGDSLARMGGDEFVAVLLDLAEDSPLFARLLAAVAEPVLFNGFDLTVSASLGIAFYPQADEVDADQLLRQADQAMYQVKSKGKNGYLVFDTEHDRSVRGRHEEVARLRHALEAREFVLHYQPKVNLRTGAVVGAEALIRWQHPDYGLRAPAEFLPLIEDHPLAVELGEWVLDTALTDQAVWRAAGLEIQVSVNVGGLQLQRPDFVSRLGDILARHPLLKPGALELEVLETSALGELAQVSKVIEDCRAMGVSMALDDFGTGYSSLTYLKRLPVATLKIDRSFVQNMLQDPDDLAILEGVISLAGAFHREVIAEGVETREHGALLLQLGCELVQGFGIARPMPPEQLPSWAAAWQASPVWSDGTQVGAIPAQPVVEGFASD